MERSDVLCKTPFMVVKVEVRWPQLRQQLSAEANRTFRRKLVW